MAVTPTLAPGYLFHGFLQEVKEIQESLHMLQELRGGCLGPAGSSLTNPEQQRRLSGFSTVGVGGEWGPQAGLLLAVHSTDAARQVPPSPL